MDMTGSGAIRRVGLVPAAVFAVLSLWSLRIGYRIWQNPAQYVVVETESAFVLYSAIVVGVLMVFSVFFTIALKVYRWSIADPAEAGATNDN